MQDSLTYFDWPDVQLRYYYAYFILAALVAGYLVFKSKSRFKPELFFISFYLLTGNLNQLLTIKIPGFSLFEIQPIRFIFLLLSFLVLRKTIFSKAPIKVSLKQKVPWFQFALLGYVILITASVLYNSTSIGIGETLKTIIDATAFLVLIAGLQLMADKPSYDIIGKSIIFGAVVSSVVSFVQLGIDPYFLRIGDVRLAFGSVLRSNGIFSTEYFNSYYLILATAWALISQRNKYLKIALVALFILGVVTTFQRMSWLIMTIVLITYVVYVQRIKVEKLIFIMLAGVALLLSIGLFFARDIANSALVKERLTDSVDRRKGYYTMVLNNIGKKPVFGYGDLKNEVYYSNILKITRDRERATAESGDLHSGYFSAMYLYGIPAFIFFVLFVVLSVIYYSKALQRNMYFVIPFLASIIYMLGNLTNTFLFLKYIAILFAIHIGIGMGLNRIATSAVDKKRRN